MRVVQSLLISFRRFGYWLRHHPLLPSQKLIDGSIRGKETNSLGVIMVAIVVAIVVAVTAAVTVGHTMGVTEECPWEAAIQVHWRTYPVSPPNTRLPSQAGSRYSSRHGNRPRSHHSRPPSRHSSRVPAILHGGRRPSGLPKMVPEASDPETFRTY